MNDDLWKDLVRRQISKLEKDVLFGDASTASSTEPKPTTKDDLDSIEGMIEALAPKQKDPLHEIVITMYAPHHAMLKCLHGGKWYLLINKLDWPQIKASIPESKPDLIGVIGTMLGVPVVEDDELAREILVAAIARSPKLSDTDYWRNDGA